MKGVVKLDSIDTMNSLGEASLSELNVLLDIDRILAFTCLGESWNHSIGET